MLTNQPANGFRLFFCNIQFAKGLLYLLANQDSQKRLQRLAKRSNLWRLCNEIMFSIFYPKITYIYIKIGLFSFHRLSPLGRVGLRVVMPVSVHIIKVVVVESCQSVRFFVFVCKKECRYGFDDSKCRKTWKLHNRFKVTLILPMFFNPWIILAILDLESVYCG